ncbi:MAG TPA: arsenosugar biosynthesis radical SAM (seleno)protein ArsS, partial [Candidatus Krumholzibacteria bacterium]|nr:arsenosugar biosynthesis radical SAM (seleno)protein ArsS [Candidatus Krumholzibacteria bacterium]
VQVNVGLTCNIACEHCHVSSSPRRTEQMSWETMEQVLRVARETGAGVLDITGGAPEMNPHFRRFVATAAGHRLSVMVRTNLTILLEPGYVDLPEFFAAHRVRLIASLPCYTKDNVDRQRGDGVYEGSIEAMRRLNALGYGRDSDLPLDLVYNPGGASLPGDQASLEADYKRELWDRHGLVFTRLYTITNMPIGRFMTALKKENKASMYRDLLRSSFNEATIAPLMCRHQIDVDWTGVIYDCDFNLALRMPARCGDQGGPIHVRDFDARLHTRRIVTGEHCFGCTAGHGSSCGGALA